MDSLTQLGLKNQNVAEIKEIQAELSILINLVENEEFIVELSNGYWKWYPYTYKFCPDVDAGDLFLGQADFSSSNIEDILKAFELLKKIIFYVREYKVELSELKDLIQVLNNHDCTRNKI